MANPQLARQLSPLVDRLRTDVCWIKHPGQPPSSIKEALTPGKLARHCNGGPAYGAAAIKPGTSVTLALVFDLDSHGGETDWEGMRQAAVRLCDALDAQGYHPLAFRSTGGHGIHVYLVWDDPQDAYSARQMANKTLASLGFTSGTKGVSRGQIEVFPKQDSVPSDGYGSMFILPLAGASVPLDPMLDLAVLPKDSPLEWIPSAPVPVLIRPERGLAIAEPSGELLTFAEALRALPNDDDVDYDEWRNTIFSIHHASGGSDEGLALAHEWSARSPKYDPDFLDERVWPYIVAQREGGITDRYVLAKAEVPVTAGEFDGLDDLTEKPKRHPFTPIQAAEFAKAGEGVEWLIPDILPAHGVCMIYGPSRSGKTFMALDMAFAIARGLPWRKKPTQQGRVVYVAAEGATGFRKRMRAFAQHNDIDLADIDFYGIDAAPSMLERPQMAKLATYVNAIGGAPLTVFDTVAQVTAGGNENSGEDMGRALRNCQDYGKAVHGGVLLLHHTGKDEERGSRGWSGILGALDAELRVSSSGDDRVVVVTKMKDGEEGAEYPFELETVDLLGEVDNLGRAVKSCVVRHRKDGPGLDEIRAKGKAKMKPMGSVERVLWDRLLDLIPPGGDGVDEEILVADVVSLLPRGTSARDRRRDVVVRALGLLANGQKIARLTGKILPVYEIDDLGEGV